jgi:S1-C subfamily serine protease
VVPAGCGGGGDDAEAVAVVTIAAQPCARPQRARGLGVAVAEGLVATAAHTVEGDLRRLTVDGVAGRVVAVDPRADLALLQADVDARPVVFAADDVDPIGSARLHLADGPHPVDVVRTGPLVVDDVTEHVRHRRDVHTFSPGVESGASGAPLTTTDGRLLGVVVLDRTDTDEAHAVTARELRSLVEQVGEGSPAPPGCPG